MTYEIGLTIFAESTKLVGQFEFPLIYNLLATFLFALTGVILATKRGYDLIGVGILALITGAGGGLIRDGIFLQQGPVLFIQSPQFILAVFYAILIGSFAYHVVKKFNVLFYTADALGLGIYGIILLNWLRRIWNICIDCSFTFGHMFSNICSKKPRTDDSEESIVRNRYLNQIFI